MSIENKGIRLQNKAEGRANQCIQDERDQI